MNDPNERSEQQARRLAYLIAGFMRSTLTEEEHDELDDWVAASDENMQLFEKLTDEKNFAEFEASVSRKQSLEELEKSKQNLKFSDKTRNKGGKSFLIVLAAACVVVVIAGFYFFNKTDRTIQPDNKITERGADAQPGTYKALLTLSSGEKIELNNSKAGKIAREGFVGISQSDFGLVYSDSGHSSEIKSNILTVPFKSFFRLLLSDGSKVWLNAGSELVYPAAFQGNQRVVELTGEAYFEVAGDASKPFIVKTKKTETKVIGTHFNIHSYSDEASTVISLLEGSIKASFNQRDILLKPGEELLTSEGNYVKRVIEDSAVVIGWKNGQFEFKNTPIEEIMNQLSRWYGVKVVYVDKPDQLFNASIDRTLPLSKILRYLQLTNKVNFKFENQTITVMK